MGVRARRVDGDAALERGERVFHPTHFAQADAVVVGDVGVIQHAVQRFEQRQGRGVDRRDRLPEYLGRLERLHGIATWNGWGGRGLSYGRAGD
jgi:hypothetical protein